MKQVSQNYYDTFRPLLSVQPQFDLASLFQTDSDLPSASPPSPSIRLLSFWSSKPKPVPVETLLRKKVKLWTETLDGLNEEVRYNSQELVKLQEVIGRISRENKVQILKEAFKENFPYGDKEERIFSKLQMMIVRTLMIPALERLRHPRPVFNRKHCGVRNPQRLMNHPGLSCMFLSSKPVPKRSGMKRSKSDADLWKTSVKKILKLNGKKIDPVQLQEKIALEQQKLERMGCARAVTVFDPKWGKDWDGKLISRFKEVHEQAVVCAVASQLDPLQALLLFHCILYDSSQQWKLVYLLGSMNYDTFVEILSSFAISELEKLNQILRHSTPQEIMWFEKEFEIVRDGLIRDCNKMKEIVDSLAYKFRHNLEGIDITRLDIEKLRELKDYIKLRVRAVSTGLHTLAQGIIINPETRHVLFKGMIKEYTVLKTRLIETRKYPERPAGCLLPILFRNVFKRARTEDDDDQVEIFGAWNLFYPIHYREVGLFGSISQQEFDRLIRKDNTLAYQLGKENLQKLGIETIADLKRLLIFNRTLLGEHLSDEERSRQLTLWTREAINR